MDKKRYYSVILNEVENKNHADIYIYGDIVSWPWLESDVSSYNLAHEIKDLDVDTINVYINSYGGEVSEGLAIYNALSRHTAKVATYADGFACSAASVVFMAGDERIMSNASLLFIHNALMVSWGDANGLRKDAEDLDIITQASINAYMDHVNLSEDELRELMDRETWLSAEKAVEHGFATKVTAVKEQKAVSQNVREKVANMILKPPTKMVADLAISEDKLREIVQEQVNELVRTRMEEGRGEVAVVVADETPVEKGEESTKELASLIESFIGRTL